jgi:hypothetical protein
MMRPVDLPGKRPGTLVTPVPASTQRKTAMIAKRRTRQHDTFTSGEDRVAHLRPTSIEPYASVALTDDQRRERTRLYVVVVHGTTLGGQPGSWFQPGARDPDHPFCAKLSEQLQMFGIPFRVWLNCDELDMEEFRWSGANDHHARLQAARDLAAYLNACHQRCLERFAEKPAFVLIGHSHGGNVILASLGLLTADVAVASIHLMGTPCFLYAERPPWTRAAGRQGRPPSWRNIYLSAPIRCPLNLYYATFGSEIDEVLGLFSLLRLRHYLGPLTQTAVAKLSRRPRPLVLEDHPVVDMQLVRFGSGATLAELGYLHSVGIYPSRAQRRRLRLRHLRLLAAWPARRLALRIAGPMAERAVERAVFRLATGLEPALFEPTNVRVSPWDGAQALQRRTEWIPLPEAIRVGQDLRLADALRAGDIGGDVDADEAQLRAVTALVQRVGEFAGGFTLMHTAYYRSDYVIQRIARRLLDDLGISFPRLVTLEGMQVESGRITTVVRQPDGGTRTYEFMVERAEAAGDEPPSPISP